MNMDVDPIIRLETVDALGMSVLNEMDEHRARLLP